MVKKSLSLSVVTNSEKEITSFALPSEIFAVNASNKLLTQYTYVYLHNLKSSKGSVKTRSEVTGSTRKIFRQKGTGRARHGDIKAPIFVGGGVALGPTGEYRKLKLTKKMKRKALFYALTLKLAENNLTIISDKLVKAVKKTTDAAKLITKVLGKDKVAYLVLSHQAPQRTSFLNLGNIEVREPSNLNAYRVLATSKLIFSESGLTEFIALFKHE